MTTIEEKLFRNYRKLMIVPVLLLIFSAFVLIGNYTSTGEFVKKNIELRGGSRITVALSSQQEDIIRQTLPSASVRGLWNPIEGYSATIEYGEGSPEEVVDILKSSGVDVVSYSSEEVGPALSEAFWSQVQTALLFALVVMGIIVFVVFRNPVPSLAVFSCAFADVLVTLALTQFFGMELSMGIFAGLLMILGYSIDSDILLTNKMLKGEGSITDRMKSVAKTIFTMSATTFVVLLSLYFATSSFVLREIASVLMIGISVDIIFTWLQNANLLWMFGGRGK